MFRKYFRQMRRPFHKVARQLLFRLKPVDPQDLFRPFRGRGAPWPNSTQKNRGAVSSPVSPPVVVRVAGGQIIVPDSVDTAKLSEVHNRVQLALLGRGNGQGDPRP